MYTAIYMLFEEFHVVSEQDSTSQTDKTDSVLHFWILS